jgi:hypothetical protein
MNLVLPGNLSSIAKTFVRFQVHSAVTMNGTIFWDVTLYGLVEAYRSFGGTYRFHLEGRRISRASSKQSSASTTLHGVTFQNMIFAESFVLLVVIFTLHVLSIVCKL